MRIFKTTQEKRSAVLEALNNKYILVWCEADVFNDFDAIPLESQCLKNCTLKTIKHIVEDSSKIIIGVDEDSNKYDNSFFMGGNKYAFFTENKQKQDILKNYLNGNASIDNIFIFDGTNNLKDLTVSLFYDICLEQSCLIVKFKSE